MSAPKADGLRVLMTCALSAFDALIGFYTQTLGFECEHRREEGEEALAGLRRDGSRLLLASPGAFGVGAEAPSTAVTVILMHPDVSAHRKALSARYDGEVGPLREMGSGRFYALKDPCGNAVWIMQVE